MKYLIKVLVKTIIRTIISIFLFPFLLFKYNLVDKEIKYFLRYIKINVVYFQKFRTLPNLNKPDSFNEYINRYKFFEIPSAIELSDKLQAKDIVSKFITTLKTEKVWGKFSFSIFKEKGVYKLNSDSGGVYIRNDVRNFFSETNMLIRFLIPYGWWVGEWPYPMIQTKIFKEEFLDELSDIADYKFFCVNGKVVGCHYIYDRHKETKTKELWIDINGCAFEWQIYDSFDVGNSDDWVKPDSWFEMIKKSEDLSKKFEFVRVDLYNTSKGVFFGELTFWPQAGYYKGRDIDKLWGAIKIKLK
jgi:hypothetical protein